MGDTMQPQAVVPWECPAEHAMGQPSVGNEERPLFTVTNKRDKKIESQDTSLPISPALQQGGCPPPSPSHKLCSLAWRDETNSCWGSFGTNQATLPHRTPGMHTAVSNSLAGSGLSPAALAPSCNPAAGTGEGKASSQLVK